VLPGVAILWADVKGPVRDLLEISGVAEQFGATHFFATVHDAVEFAKLSGWVPEQPPAPQDKARAHTAQVV
jgi:hypothetical protein